MNGTGVASIGLRYVSQSSPTRCECCISYLQEKKRRGMKIESIGSIRTPFGVVELVPQDRNILQASSVGPLQIRGASIHLWALLERTRETWGISGLVEPLLHL